MSTKQKRRCYTVVEQHRCQSQKAQLQVLTLPPTNCVSLTHLKSGNKNPTLWTSVKGYMDDIVWRSLPDFIVPPSRRLSSVFWPLHSQEVQDEERSALGFFGSGVCSRSGEKQPLELRLPFRKQDLGIRPLWILLTCLSHVPRTGLAHRRYSMNMNQLVNW